MNRHRARLIAWMVVQIVVGICYALSGMCRDKWLSDILLMFFVGSLFISVWFFIEYLTRAGDRRSRRRMGKRAYHHDDDDD